MIKYFKINEQLTDDLHERFVFFMNSLSEGDTVIIYFSSSGGNSTVADNLLSIFNSDDRIINVVFSWQVSSSAFDLMCRLRNDKLILNRDVWSTVHKYSIDVSTTELRNKDKQAMFLMKEVDKFNDEYYMDLEALGFTQEQLDMFDKCEDVYLSYDDIMKLNIW